jgi:hypothetical protein
MSVNRPPPEAPQVRPRSPVVGRHSQPLPAHQLPPRVPRSRPPTPRSSRPSTPHPAHSEDSNVTPPVPSPCAQEVTAAPDAAGPSMLPGRDAASSPSPCRATFHRRGRIATPVSPPLGEQGWYDDEPTCDGVWTFDDHSRAAAPPIRTPQVPRAILRRPDEPRSVSDAESTNQSVSRRSEGRVRQMVRDAHGHRSHSTGPPQPPPPPPPPVHGDDQPILRSFVVFREADLPPPTQVATPIWD